MSKIKVIIACFIFVVMLTSPQLVYDSTVFAIDTWWRNVLPALLPFFIVSEFMLEVGVMECFALWLEPVMRPFFRLSGASALAIVMGFVSGTPTAANITAGLYRKNLCTKDEAERLLAFTNNSGPLYILVAVATGIFQNPAVGILLFISHYPVNFLIGLFLRFLAKDKRKAAVPCRGNVLKAGYNLLKCCPTPPLGSLLNTVVKKSLLNIGLVGGFMVVFGILTAAFDRTGITTIICHIFAPVCAVFGISESCLPAIASGFWEMTIGIAILPDSGADMLSMLMASAMVLAWNGVSIQSQVSAMVADTGLSLRKYRICRIIHSAIAPLIVLALYKKTAPVFAAAGVGAVKSFSYLTPLAMLILSLLILLGISLLGIRLARRKQAC